jgi:hypothetical protein
MTVNELIRELQSLVSQDRDKGDWTVYYESNDGGSVLKVDTIAEDSENRDITLG